MKNIIFLLLLPAFMYAQDAPESIDLTTATVYLKDGIGQTVGIKVNSERSGGWSMDMTASAGIGRLCDDRVRWLQCDLVANYQSPGQLFFSVGGFYAFGKLNGIGPVARIGLASGLYTSSIAYHYGAARFGERGAWQGPVLSLQFTYKIYQQKHRQWADWGF